jgi:hypothetical protein
MGVCYYVEVIDGRAKERKGMACGPTADVP